MLKSFPEVPVTLLEGQSQLALQACDAVLIASGTATLEAMLFKRPMVVAYRLAGLTYRILKLMVKSRYFALPNLLAGEALVPELIQQAATADNLACAVEQQLRDGSRQAGRFLELHQQLRLNASSEAAKRCCSCWKLDRQSLSYRHEHSMQLNFIDFPEVTLLAGVDEVGRGPLCGPVVAAAVILDPQRPVAGLQDSKKLTEKTQRAGHQHS